MEKGEFYSSYQSNVIKWSNFYENRNKDTFISLFKENISIAINTVYWIVNKLWIREIIKKPPLYFFVPGRIETIDEIIIAALLGLATSITNYLPVVEPFQTIYYVAPYIRVAILEQLSFLQWSPDSLNIPVHANIGAHKILKSTVHQIKLYLDNLSEIEYLYARQIIGGVTFIGDIEKLRKIPKTFAESFETTLSFKLIELTREYFCDPISITEKPYESGCPQCGHSDIASIVYGLIGTYEDFLEIQKNSDRKVIPGGCVIYPGAPKYSCQNCNFQW